LSARRRPRLSRRRQLPDQHRARARGEPVTDGEPDAGASPREPTRAGRTPTMSRWSGHSPSRSSRPFTAGKPRIACRGNQR
jgi:hypothetical protein